MKRLSVVLVIGLLSSVYCFAQTQMGDASYNASKSGLTIAHSAMSFGTRVRITNLRNNREVIATVNARIPASDPRIADISKEAGDAIGMTQAGYTRIRLEKLEPEQVAVAPAPVAASPPPPRPAPAAAPVPAPPPAQESIIENVQVVSQPPAQYLVMPPQVQACPNSPFCLVMLILLIIALLLLTAILVLLLCIRRLPWSAVPWYYPVSVRRHIRYLKRHR